MIEEGRFGTFEAISLVTVLMVSKVFYTDIGKMVDIAGTAAWLSTLISCATALFFFFLTYRLMKRFPGMDIIDVFRAVLGKFTAVVLGIFFSAYSIFYAGSNLREFVEMIKAYSLPYTPTSLVVACVLVVSFILCYFGLECLARVSALCIFPIITGIAFILLFAIPNYDPLLIRPFWGYGIITTLQTGFLRSSGYSEVMILTFIVKSLQDIKSFRKTGFASISITGTILVITLMFYVMTFGYTSAMEKISGLYEMSRIIYFNRFFQRVEAVFLFIWVIASVVAVAISLYIGISIYCKTFRLKNHRPLIWPFIFLAFMTAMLPNSLSEVVESNIQLMRHYSLIWQFVSPTVVLLIAVISGKRGGNPGESKE